MKRRNIQKSASFLYSLISVIICGVTFIFVILSFYLSNEISSWHCSNERKFLLLAVISLLVISLSFLLFQKTKTVNLLINWYLSSKIVYIFSCILLFTLVILTTASFARLFRQHNTLSLDLFPLMILLFCLSLETIIGQLINTQGKIGGKTWICISSNKLTRENKLIILAIFMASAFLICLAINFYRGYYQGKPYPYNSFLFDPYYRFSDFYTVLDETQGMNPYGKFISGQYPFLLVLGSFFSFIKLEVSIVVYFLSFIIVYFIISYHFLRIENKLISLLLCFAITTLSYPFFFAIDRGNFEIFVFVFLLIFVFLYQKQRYWSAAIILGFAAALKIYPLIFVILFLKDKKFKEVIISMFVMIGLTLFSLAMFEGGFITNLKYLWNFSNINNNWLFISFTSLDEGTYVQRGVSLLTLIKVVFHQLQIPVSEILSQKFILIYLVFVSMATLLIVYYVIWIENTLWKNLALLTVCMLVLPTLSADYKLLHMYLPLFIFINAKDKTRLDLLFIFLFGIILIPKNYYFLQNVFSDAKVHHDISLAVPINIIVLLLMVVSIIISGLVAQKQKSKDNYQVTV